MASEETIEVVLEDVRCWLSARAWPSRIAPWTITRSSSRASSPSVTMIIDGVPATTSTFLSAFGKPMYSTRTVSGPAGTDGSVNSPWRLVDVDTPVSVTLTRAPGRGAPLASTTRPPRTSCAEAGSAIAPAASRPDKARKETELRTDMNAPSRRWFRGEKLPRIEARISEGARRFYYINVRVLRRCAMATLWAQTMGQECHYLVRVSLRFRPHLRRITYLKNNALKIILFLKPPHATQPLRENRLQLNGALG